MTGVLHGVALGVSGAPGKPQAISSGSAGANCTLVVKNDGSYTMSGTAGSAWVAPQTAAVAAHWQVKVDVTSGALSSGTIGTWIDCSSADSNRTWVENSGACTLTISFREKATGTVRSVQTGVTMTI